MDDLGITLVFHIQDHGIEFVRNIQFDCFINIAFCIFRTGQLFAKTVEAETIVDALVQDPAEFTVTFQDQHIFSAFFFCFDSSGETRRASA